MPIFISKIHTASIVFRLSLSGITRFANGREGGRSVQVGAAKILLEEKASRAFLEDDRDESVSAG